ncbi:hypothetical protein FJR48_08835 [Sulfurimonas lithotrophica]|uniref:Periplasmic protein n=1 Tax=Sulfurimonas lithotrophica TaxID=2590022 RepID=A0A5P8P2B6_9BACT|nr:hypothetical protein [Sulfurimonas lithotrophica]QFR49824.1 hypothetical protein FJR48_08835 [Sulfurimonas lithotrophica]
MNKKIILGLTVSTLLASSLLAYPQGGMQQKNQQTCMKSKMMKHKKGRGGHMFISTVMKLDLSTEQRTKIRDIVKKSMLEAPNPHNAFSDTSFNKDKFIKLAKERRDSKIERKADMIEKVYALLDASQKKDLKTMLDMKDIMKKNKGGNCNFKNCQNK